MKIDVPLEKANRLINSGQVIMVSCADGKPARLRSGGRSTIVTLAWNMPLCHQPSPLLAISLATKRFSYELIKKSNEFIVNIPSMDLFDEMMYCGTHSGRDADKFKETDLTALKAKILIQAPAVKECIGHLECRLKAEHEAGDHKLLVGEIVAAYADKGLFDQRWLIDKVKLIYHLGDKFFTESGKEIVAK